MDENSLRTAAGGLALGVLALIFPARPARAQLENVVWTEGILLTSSDGSDSKLGIDPAAPEPLFDSLSGAGYSLDASVTFPLMGAPNAAAAVGLTYESGLSLVGGAANSTIAFQFRVVGTGTPPPGVVTVPVHVQAQGSAEADGNAALRAASFSQFTLSSSSGPILFWAVEADNVEGGPPGSDSFANEDQFDLTPGQVASGEMIVDASLGTETLDGPAAASATANLDPVIEIADAIIPGTSANYRDHYVLELSPGYFALGQVPAQDATWGEIKRRYAH